MDTKVKTCRFSFVSFVSLVVNQNLTTFRSWRAAESRIQIAPRSGKIRLEPERLGPVRDWISHYERFWDDRFDRLRQHLKKGGKG